MPWRLRITLRRISARVKRVACKDVWPINESSGQPPPGWAGWPEGKKFALVLTHDVEGPEGLANCRRLAELEMKFGFRSSFNFIPEGPYSVPEALRTWLTDNGFEVGVHDLKHNGKLFQSHLGFKRKAARINHYLREWGATGFRAGFMLRNLDWLHDLNIGYDSSTFDTDPFELQSEGTGTIFPFWIPPPGAPSGKSDNETRAQGGYVELPYTLPQDSTLFLVLQEPSPDIWFRKLDWIAAHGGMALANVHPDYLHFDGDKPSPRKYSVGLYSDFLQHVLDRYRGKFWPALPREIAANVSRPPSTAYVPSPDRTSRRSPPPVKTTAGRILMLLENSYPSDSRVRNEATRLTSAGYQVTVISLGGPGKPRLEMVNGVRVFRVPRLELFSKTIAAPSLLGRLVLVLKTFIGYTVEYTYFTSACFFISCYVFLRYGFDAIHAHNPPDTLFLVAAPFKLLGKKFVFDHHDLCPELYMSRYQTGECTPTRLLRVTEWCTLKLADITIATNESYKSVQLGRGRRDPRKIFVVRNGPDERRMTPAPPSQRLRAMNKCILVYIGCLNPQDGVDYLLRSLRHLLHDLKRPDFHCVIMGKGDSLEDLRSLSHELQLDGYVELPGYVSDEELWANLAAADICVDPDPSSPLNDVSTWIKVMEYMAYGKPIVTFDLKETRVSAQGAAVYVRPNNELEFAQAVAGLMDAPDQREKMGALGRKRVVDDLQWSVVGQNLLNAYQHLLGSPRQTTASVGTSESSAKAHDRRPF